MDSAGCHWQDMLLPYYIKASSVTLWPLSYQCLGNPMLIDYMNYRSTVINDLDAVISLLQPGVEEISRKCGVEPANRVRRLLNKLHFLQHDALKYTNLYLTSIPNYGN